MRFYTKRRHSHTALESEDDLRAARILMVLLLAVLAIYGMTVFAGLYWHDQKLTMAPLAAGAVLAVSLVLLKRGHLRQSSLLFMLSIFGLVTAVSTFGQGIHDPAVIVYPIIILFLGLTLPGLAFRIGVALTLASVGWLVFGEQAGLFLAQPSPQPNWVYFMIIGAILLAGALAVDLLATNLRRNASAARQELAHRRRVEDALRESEERYRSIVELSVIGIGVSQGNEVKFANKALLRIFGYDDLEELKKVPLVELVAPSSRGLIAERMKMAAEEKSVPQEFEYEVVTKGGQTKTLLASSARFSQEGETYTQSTFQDVTERKQAEGALRESEEKFRSSFMTGLDAFYIATLDEGRIVEINEVFEDVFGYSREEAIGRTSIELGLYHEPADRARMVSELKANGFVRDLELRARRKGGELFTLSISVRTLAIAGKPHILGVIRDISERLRAEEALREREEQLRQSQKMEAVGLLAGGIAHDFNNLLTAILGYSDLLLGREELADSLVRKDIEEIQRAAERAAALTRQILAFSRRQTLRPSVVSPNEVIDAMEPLLRRTLGANIELITSKDPDLGFVEADVHQLEQVLMNLAVNARDAMPSGGRLTMQTANAQLDKRFCRTHPGAVPGSYVMFSVSDTGMGMDDATLRRIFEPFFTTKPPGEGTGLGLATVYGVVNQSNGSISVQSELGDGSTFSIYLPRVAPPVSEDVESASVRTPAQGQEVILLVEDEAPLRDLVQRVLGRLGYRVLVAGTAAEALRLARRANGALDLLLTDVVLPGGLQGNELARDLLASSPDLPVLYVSGYARDAISHAGRLDPRVNFLEKPFTPATLAATVRTVLDEARSLRTVRSRPYGTPESVIPTQSILVAAGSLPDKAVAAEAQVGRVELPG